VLADGLGGLDALPHARLRVLMVAAERQRADLRESRRLATLMVFAITAAERGQDDALEHFDRLHGDPRPRTLELVLAPIELSTLAGQRDRALLLLGFAAALRRSELVALNVEDLESDASRGLKLTIRKSKTDQQQAGAQVAVPYARETDRCAVRALSAWLQVGKIRRGPVFRRMRRGDTVGQERLTDQSVALIIKHRAQAAALPAELLPKLSGHSLRAGYATAAAAAGIEERKIANVTRHKNLPVLRRYIRTATAFDDVGEVL
jgi:integrase